MNITHPQLVRALAKPGDVIQKEMTGADAHLMHMAIGICGEAGEMMDAIKKQVIYRKELDRANVIEELGDLEFYMEGLRQGLGITREETLAANIAKLSVRYEKLSYSDKQAAERADKTITSFQRVEAKRADKLDNETAKWHKDKKEESRKGGIFHHLHAGKAPCGIAGVPRDWPKGHWWSANWGEVNCPDCLKHKPEIQKVESSPRRRPPVDYDDGLEQSSREVK